MSNEELEPGEPEEPEQQYEIIIQPEQLAGLWANLAQVSYTEHEFTVDFIRSPPRRRFGQGVP